ncbi:MAG: hypothetical protein IPJ82_23860 [Lewinellaceae bacterium]|nr:hypothetical protein [Lewinellaceae bacterium]
MPGLTLRLTNTNIEKKLAGRLQIFRFIFLVASSDRNTKNDPQPVERKRAITFHLDGSHTEHDLLPGGFFRAFSFETDYWEWLDRGKAFWGRFGVRKMK